MIRRSSRLLLEVLAAFTAGVVLLVGVATWRLSQDEPISLAFLTSDIEAALTPADGRFNVEIGDTVLTWAGWERTFDLRARGVRIHGADGRMIATVPEVGLTLSLRGILKGMVAPTAVEIRQPHIMLLRDAGGRFRFLRVPEENAPPVDDETSPVMPTMLEALLAPPDDNLSTGFLRLVEVTDAKLTFIDRRTGLTWHASTASIALRRGAGGILGRMNLSVDRLGDPARLAIDVSYENSAQRLAVKSEFGGVNVSALGELLPVLGAFGLRDFVVDGRLTTTLGLDGGIGDSTFEIAGGAGRLDMPGSFEEPVAVRSVSLRGHTVAGTDVLTVDEVQLQLDGPRISAVGQLTGFRSGLVDQDKSAVADMQFKIDRIPVPRLAAWWPINAGANPRQWVTERITAGVIEELRADVRLRLPLGDPAASVIEKFTGGFEGRDLTIHYLADMPPIEAAVGTAFFTRTEFGADFIAGQSAGIVVDRGTLRITGLDLGEQTTAITADLLGDLGAAMALLDHPRLGYAKALGFDPAAMAGDVAVKLDFAFPAVRDLTFESIEVKATGDVTGATVRQAAFGQDLTEATLALTLDKNAMRIDGAGNFAGVPIRFQWDERFTGNEFRRRIATTGTVDAFARARLGLDLRPNVDGPMPADLVFTWLDSRRSTLDAKLKLDEAALQWPLFEWQKASGTPGAAEVILEMIDGRVAEIPRFTVAAGDLVAAGAAALAPETGKLKQLEFSELNIGRTRLQSVAVKMIGDRPDIAIGGGTIDASVWLAADDPAVAVQPETNADESARPEVAEEPTPAFALRAPNLSVVHLGEGRELKDVSVVLHHDGKFWDEIDAKGTVEGAPLSLRYKPAGDKHMLGIESSDAGAVLRAFDIVSSVKGGKLMVTGEAVDAEPHRPLVGRAEIDEFRVVDAPVLARLLSIATLTGFVDVLSGEGFQFGKFESDFTKTQGVLAIKLAKAHGPSIGLTAKGVVDFDADTVEISGTIVPAYAINSLLNNIPILGDLLMGGEGEGMFAAVYHASGPLHEPRIVVNPLAAIAPGFLRGLFEIFDSSGAAPTDFDALPPPPQGSQK